MPMTGGVRAAVTAIVDAFGRPAGLASRKLPPDAGGRRGGNTVAAGIPAGGAFSIDARKIGASIALQRAVVTDVGELAVMRQPK